MKFYNGMLFFSQVEAQKGSEFFNTPVCFIGSSWLCDLYIIY